MKNRLFLVCPDCFIEQTIRKHYGPDSFFLTALGSVFHINSFEYAEEINSFLSGEDVMDIYVVNDVQCTFIRNTMTIQNHQTKAEQKLAQLYLDNLDDFEDFTSDEDKAKHLALLNIKRQAKDLSETAFLGSKIQDGSLRVKGLLYDRSKEEFKEISL